MDRENWKPIFEQVDNKTLSQKIWNIWKKWDDIKYIQNIDIKEAILEELKSAWKSLTIKSIQADLKEMYGLLKQKLFEKLADKIADFILKRFPAGRLSEFAIWIADKLVTCWWKRKTKLKENNEKKNKPKIRLTFNREHIKGDSTGWGHFPWYRSKWVSYENIVVKNGVRKADIIINGTRWEDKGIFPDDWGLKELKEIRTIASHDFAKKILQWEKNVEFKYKGIMVRVVVTYSHKESWKNGKKVYKIKTLFPF